MTLIDYPGKIAATVFTVGCNLRCPFCHNPELVLPESNVFQKQAFQEKDFFTFLEKRKNRLEGVCITGGEPTLQTDLLEFIAKIKKLGFLVKLDTNGTRPDVLKNILEKKLVDYVAMDIKAAPQNYHRLVGRKIDIQRIELSVELIRRWGDAGKIDYEFRTTVVPGLHSEEDFDIIGEWLAGAKRYILQKYKDAGKILDSNLRKQIEDKDLDLEKIKNHLFSEGFQEVRIR